MIKTESLNVYLVNRPLAAKEVLFTAIRTAYSPKAPIDVWLDDFKEYEAKEAADGKGGTETDRLIRHIVSSGHTSTLEHVSFTFLVSGVSRALLAQLTRHRVGVSPTVQSQRYVGDNSEGRKGGFGVIVPEKIQNNPEALATFENTIGLLQMAYDRLVSLGIPKEDARSVLPNAASTNITLTMNLRAILHFYHIRHEKGGAQKEIKDFAEVLKDTLVKELPWIEYLFEAYKEK